MRRTLASLALLALAPFTLLVTGSAHAQAWPAKPVRLVVSTGPGMSTDIVGRLVADRLGRALGQPFVVENIAGAGGIIAAQSVARATPDGYAMLFTGGGTLVTNQFAFKSLPYDPVKDFAPIALVTRASGFLVLVNPLLPVKNVPELVAYAKANPSKLSYAVDTSNIYVSLAGRMLARTSGTEIVEIPYKSIAQALQDTIAGRTQIILSSAASADPAMRAGKLRLIAVTSNKRLSYLPDTAALSETYPSLNLDAVGFSVVAPSATPRDIVNRTNRTILTLQKDAQFEEQLASQGQAVPPPMSPEEVADLLQENRVRWGRIFQDLAIQPQ